jgi:hypothetical protein
MSNIKCCIEPGRNSHLSTKKAEAEGWRVQDQSGLHTKFEINLGYIAKIKRIK